MDREAAAIGDPPPFLRLTSHPIRWRLLRELAKSDRPVRELSELVAEAQPLVSYHLRALRDGGLVRSRRSSADGRDSYYAIDLRRCEELLLASATALHPGLGVRTSGGERPRSPRRRRPSVLFLCTGNSSRSQIAEALLQERSRGAADAASAGSDPKPVHPHAVRVLRDRGIDIADRRSKHIDVVRRRRFDLVVTLCDRVREVCPDLPGSPEAIHWSVADPGHTGGGPAPRVAFERTAQELEERIRFLLPTIKTPTPRRSVRDG